MVDLAIGNRLFNPIVIAHALDGPGWDGAGVPHHDSLYSISLGDVYPIYGVL